MEMTREEFKRFLRQQTDVQVRVAYLDHTSLVHRDVNAIAIIEQELEARGLPLIKYDEWNGRVFK